MTPPASGAVPRRHHVDHQDPSEFVVRCTHCGRLAVVGDRARAHTRADNHALRCRSTGVTPVSESETASETESTEPGPPSATTGGLCIFDEDFTGESITVRYESVSERSGEREIVGDVVAMLPAEEDPVEYGGVILALPSQTRRRVDLLDELVECPHNSERGWRRIGDLVGVGPASAAGNPPVVMTDGGVTLDEDVETVEKWRCPRCYRTFDTEQRAEWHTNDHDTAFDVDDPTRVEVRKQTTEKTTWDEWAGHGGEGDLDALSDAQRAAYEAVENDGMGVREYARENDLSPGTVGNHLQAARERLGEVDDE